MPLHDCSKHFPLELLNLFNEVSCTDGLIWVSEWNSLQHPVSSAFLASLYSDYMLTSRTAKFSCSGDSYTPADLRKFAKSQVSKNPLFSTSNIGFSSESPLDFKLETSLYRLIMCWETIL